MDVEEVDRRPEKQIDLRRGSRVLAAPAVGGVRSERTDRHQGTRVDRADHLGHLVDPKDDPVIDHLLAGGGVRHVVRLTIGGRDHARAQVQGRRIRRQEQLAANAVGQYRVERGAGILKALHHGRPVLPEHAQADR